MAEIKKLTQTQLITELAEAVEISKKQAKAFVDKLAEVATRETKKNGLFVLPGIGRLASGATPPPAKRSRSRPKRSSSFVSLRP